MATHTVTIRASKAGSIGAKYVETRSYQIEAETRDEVNTKAIRRAFDEGLEHVLVTRIDGKTTFNSTPG
jgi:hypothetical protein